MEGSGGLRCRSEDFIFIPFYATIQIVTVSDCAVFIIAHNTTSNQTSLNRSRVITGLDRTRTPTYDTASIRPADIALHNTDVPDRASIIKYTEKASIVLAINLNPFHDMPLAIESTFKRRARITYRCPLILGRIIHIPALPIFRIIQPDIVL